MNTTTRFAITFVSIGIITACSPIDSIRPFDHQQADILLHEEQIKKPARQMISLALPRGQYWQKSGNPIKLFHDQQNEDNWREKIDTTISSYKNNPGITAIQMAKLEIDKAAQNCKQTGSEILQESRQVIVYRLNMTDCYSMEGNKQIAKLFNGIDAVYMVRYSAVEGKISKSQFDKMSQSIKTAQLVKYSNRKPI